jgi:hypothetical protein
MPLIPIRIPSPCRVVNFSTDFLLPLKEYLLIDTLLCPNQGSYDGDEHASVP